MLICDLVALRLAAGTWRSAQIPQTNDYGRVS